LVLEKLRTAHDEGSLKFFGDCAGLSEALTFAAHLKRLRRINWFVSAKRPFAGQKVVLAYLSRYTHRVAISNSRLIAHEGRSVTFRYKDYRVEGHDRQKVMTLGADEFIRRFLHRLRPHRCIISPRLRSSEGFPTPANRARSDVRARPAKRKKR
jgi:hypothetical protein